MTAVDEAKAVPVISLPGCPLVTSEAYHWSPDCDATYWREKITRGKLTRDERYQTVYGLTNQNTI